MKKLLTLILIFTSTLASAGPLIVNSNQSGESSKAAFDFLSKINMRDSSAK